MLLQAEDLYHIKIMKKFDRSVVAQLGCRLKTDPPLIQVVTGPRQVGKTTAAQTVADAWQGPVHLATADLALPPGPEWIETHWQLARGMLGQEPALLILDEVQKVRHFGEVVKAMWDDDRRHARPLRVVLLGSSALLLAAGVTESLAGRFFLHRCQHWQFDECRRAFGWDLDTWLYFGGYPGAAPLVHDEPAWHSYIADALIESVLARDVLALQVITKPTLLRHVFMLAARFPAQILSYNKMLGQLQDAGNTTTLAHYLELLQAAFLVTGLQKFSAGHARSRGSSPKLVLWNNALVSALGLRSFETWRRDPVARGWWVENAVGAHLVNHLQGVRYEVCYWRERNVEVDYVVRCPDGLVAIEVKSGRPARPAGLSVFRRQYPAAIPLLVGSGGMPLDDFFAADPTALIAALIGQRSDLAPTRSS